MKVLWWENILVIFVKSFCKCLSEEIPNLKRLSDKASFSETEFIFVTYFSCLRVKAYDFLY